MDLSSTLPESDDALKRRMAALGVRESDLDESFVRSAGPGGQNVNKTATCVNLVHRPTGLRVRCQTTRHQGRNRILARTLLLDKIEAASKARLEARRAEAARISRSRRPRSRAAKEHMLQGKARRSATKAFRRRVDAGSRSPD